MINLSTPINFLSYGYCGINIFNELQKLTNVNLFPIGSIEFESKYKHIVELGVELSKTWNRNNVSVKIMHQNMLDLHPISRFYVGFPFFELDNFNTVERQHLKNQDHIFVASTWAKQLIEEKIGVDCSVINLGVDRSIFYPNPSNINREKVVFLNIGKWEKRKGHDVLANAFFRTFKDIDDVELWMMPTNKFLTKEQDRYWNDYYKKNLGEKFIRIPNLPSPSDVAEIINKSDIGIYPHRAEGFGLPLLESISCGKRIIATNYSAPKDYLNKDNSSLIDIRDLEKAEDGIFFFGSGNWAKLDSVYFDELCESMYYEYKLIKKGRTINYSGVETAEKFTWSNTALNILEKVKCF